MKNMSTQQLNKPRHHWLWLLGRVLLNTFLVLLLLLAGVVCWFLLFPPFGNVSVAKVLLIGTDDPQAKGDYGRSDMIMLCAARLDGAGTTLLSIPRDARVRLPRRRGYEKINAAYAYGQQSLLNETLAQPTLLNDTLPYYIVTNSISTRAVIDAFGGIDVDVPHAMDYDDNWDKLHIHLKAGYQHLNGTQVVGFLRWRKNNHGLGGGGTDFERTSHQRALLAGVSNELHSWRGIARLPAVYKAFHTYVRTNLTPRQFILLAWAARQTNSENIPGEMRTLHGVSYVLCNWSKGREQWQNATR